MSGSLIYGENNFDNNKIIISNSYFSGEISI